MVHNAKRAQLQTLTTEILCWILLFTAQLWITRFLIARHGPPAGAGVLLNSIKATVIDLPLILFLLFTGLFRPKNGAGPFFTALFFLCSFSFVAINYANNELYQSLGRLIRMNDIQYITQHSFIRGSFLPTVGSPTCMLTLVFPLIMIVFVYRHFSRVTHSPKQVFTTLMAVCIPLFYLRRWGYTNQVLRCIPSSQSTYSHALFSHFSPEKPLSPSEMNTLDSLHTRLSHEPDLLLQGRTLLEKPNIVLIVLESYPAVYVDSVIGGMEVTPVMNRLKTQGLWFQNFYSNSYGTSKAQWSMFSGEPAFNSQVFTTSSGVQVAFVSDILKQHRYTNAWMHGNTGSFDNRRHVLKRHGFDYIIDNKAFPPPYTKLAWGISDEEFLRRCTPKLDSLHRRQSPCFSVVLTMSNHHPYEVPDSFDKFESSPGTHADFLNTLHYSDYALGTFFAQAQKEEWFDSTYFLVTADNGMRPWVQTGNLKREIDNYFKIPFLIIGPGIPNNRRDNRFKSQVDIASTIHHLASGTPRRIGIGYSLLASTEHEPRNRVPVIGTFFEHAIIGPAGLIVENGTSGYRSHGNISDADRALYEETKTFTSLWKRASFFGQIPHNVPWAWESDVE